MTVFVDTYALIAWLNAKDSDHERVSTYFDSTRKYVTTEWVLIELADAFCSLPARAITSQFLNDIRSSASFEIVPSIPSLFESGIRLYADRPDKAWSLTDCLSFVVMTERGLTDALTADRHFAQAGFHPLFAATSEN
jgi:uncharacterized protein